MTTQQVQDAISYSKMSWKQWEVKLEGAFRVNGWDFWADRDRPTKNKKVLKARMPGHPDIFGWKYFEGLPHKELMTASGYFKPGTYQVWLEAKTGKGKPTERQLEVVQTLNKGPAVVARIVFPHDYDTVIELLGGVYPL